MAVDYLGIAAAMRAADTDAELADALQDLVPSNSAIGLVSGLTAEVQDLIARIDGLIIGFGAPAQEIGELGSMYLDRAGYILYGPKVLETAPGAGDGWGVGTPAVGATGPAGSIVSVSAITLGAGVPATVTAGGSPTERTFLFGIPTGPQGNVGATPVLGIGVVSTGAPGSDASASFTGTAGAPNLNLTIPRGNVGATGDTGLTPNASANVNIVPYGEPATVTRSGPNSAPVFTFNLPAPENGTDGRELELQKSGDGLYIQYRYTGDAGWQNLIPTSDLQGEKGDRGAAFDPDATGNTLAARDAYNAQPDGFSFLNTATGLLYYRQGATAGVWSDGVAIGAASSAILDALAALGAGTGVLVKTGAATFELRGIGAGAGANFMTRDDSDARYLGIATNVPISRVTNLQTQLDAKADAGAVVAALSGKIDNDATLAALAGLTVASDKLIYATGPDAFATTDFTAVGRTLVAQLTQAAMRTTGLGMSVNGSSLVIAADYAAMKVLLAVTAADVGALALAGGAMTGLVRLQGFLEKPAAYAAGAMDATASVFDAAVAANVTLSIANLPGSPATGDTVTLHGRVTITGTPVITWISGTKWPGGTAPTISAGVWLLTYEFVWSGSAWLAYATMTKFA